MLWLSGMAYCSRPSVRTWLIKAILECSRDLGLPTKRIPAHEQVMVLAMAFFGIAAGPSALSDAAKCASEYANGHNQAHALAACMETAADLVEACKQCVEDSNGFVSDEHSGGQMLPG